MGKTNSKKDPDDKRRSIVPPELDYENGRFVHRVQRNKKRSKVYEDPASDFVKDKQGKDTDFEKVEQHLYENRLRFSYPNYGKYYRNKAEQAEFLENYCGLKGLDLVIASLYVLHHENPTSIAKYLELNKDYVYKKVARLNLKGVKNALYNDTYGIPRGDQSYRST